MVSFPFEEEEVDPIGVPLEVTVAPLAIDAKINCLRFTVPQATVKDAEPFYCQNKSQL